MEILVGEHPDIIKLSSTGPASEKYPESLREYQLLQDISHNGHPVYQSLAREDRYIIYIGRKILYNDHKIVLIFHTRISLVHHTKYF